MVVRTLSGFKFFNLANLLRLKLRGDPLLPGSKPGHGEKSSFFFFTGSFVRFLSWQNLHPTLRYRKTMIRNMSLLTLKFLSYRMNL